MSGFADARYLTSSDVARRLGVSPGTVRHYGELLRERGYPFEKGEEGEWLWAPEVVEVARAAYQLARAIEPRLTFTQALDLIELAGRVAEQARRHELLHDLVQEVRRAAYRLHALDDAIAAIRQAGQELPRVVSRSAREMEGAAQSAMARVGVEYQAARESVRAAMSAYTVPTTLALIGLYGLVLWLLLSGGKALVWLVGVGAFIAGAAVVWFLKE